MRVVRSIGVHDLVVELLQAEGDIESSVECKCGPREAVDGLLFTALHLYMRELS
jgi:hypothetical protein